MADQEDLQAVRSLAAVPAHRQARPCGERQERGGLQQLRNSLGRWLRAGSNDAASNDSGDQMEPAGSRLDSPRQGYDASEASAGQTPACSEHDSDQREAGRGRFHQRDPRVRRFAN